MFNSCCEHSFSGKIAKYFFPFRIKIRYVSEAFSCLPLTFFHAFSPLCVFAYFEAHVQFDEDML